MKCQASVPVTASGLSMPVRSGMVLLGVLCVASPTAVWSDEASAIRLPEELAQIQPLNRLEAEQERLRQILEAKPDSYQDKVQSEGTGVLDPAFEAAPTEQEVGMSSWLVEGRLGWSERSQTDSPSSNSIEAGTRLEHHSETLNHGEWVFQADVRQRNKDLGGADSYFSPAKERQSARITLSNLGFPLTPFVFADSALGDMTSEVTDGLSRGQRLNLGGTTVRGAGVRVFGREFDLRAGLGLRGQLTGGPFPGFERADGELAWAGYTHRFSPLNFAAAQVNHANRVPWPFTSDGRDSLSADTTSLAVTAGHGYTLNTDGDRRVRLTALQSDSNLSDGTRSSANGVYLEGGLQAGRFRHEAGVFSTQPRLRFGDQWVADGSNGVFWRVDHSSTRLTWGLGLDHEDQPESGFLDSALTRTTVNGQWQYRIGRNNSWAGYLQQSRQRLGGASGSGLDSRYATLNYQDRWLDQGDSRLRLTLRDNQALVSNASRATGEELEWEQDWVRVLPGNLRSNQLRTTLGWARDRSEGDTQHYPTGGVTWQTWLAADWSLGGNLRYSSRRGNLATSRGLAGSLQTEKRLAPGWTLGGSVLLNQAVVNVNGASLLPGSVSVSRSNDKSAVVYLRYEAQRGQTYGFSGRGGQGAGAGRITGTVFFDINRDGLQQADEAGVPGVEVFLNQRSRTVTNERGQYEFSLVPTGTQRLTLRPESVALPWGAGPNSQTSVLVPLRGEVVAPLAVEKDTE